VFAGWHQIEVYDEGAITVWSKDDVPPAHKIVSDAIPAPWEGLMWGILPVGCAALAVFFLIVMPDRKRTLITDYPVSTSEPLYAREAHR